MIKLHVVDETAPLKAVVLGIAKQNGPEPKLEEAYDPKSREHIIAGTYPEESDMVREMEGFVAVLVKYGVKIFRPTLIPNCNQIFSRDIAFVIEDTLIKANILPDREDEYQAIKYIVDQIDPFKIVHPPKEVHIEGGDVMPWNEYIFVGTYTGSDYSDHITARTNKKAVDFLTTLFPNKTVKAFELKKSNTNPKENALHLDCCFQPVGKDMAILHKNGFLIDTEYEWLKNEFGPENIFEITKEEMYEMNSNIFSISPTVVVSDERFTRLNKWLSDKGITVETIEYKEIAKQEGLLRCSTLPLIRD